MAGAIEVQGEKAVGDEAGNVDEAVLGGVFDALAEVDETGGAVRRRAWKDSFSSAAQAVVHRLIAARLLTSDRDAIGGRAWVEVAHEAVLRAWPRFGAWLDNHRLFKLWRRRLNEARENWLKAERNPAELLRGPRLAEALRIGKARPKLLTAEEGITSAAAECSDG